MLASVVGTRKRSDRFIPSEVRFLSLKSVVASISCAVWGEIGTADISVSSDNFLSDSKFQFFCSFVAVDG